MILKGSVEIILYVVIMMIILAAICVCFDIKKEWKYLLIALSLIFILCYTLFPFPAETYMTQEFIDENLYGDGRTLADYWTPRFNGNLKILFEQFNFIPFRTIKECEWSISVFIRQIIGNIALFMPFGFSLAFFKDKLNLKKSIICVFLTTLSIEVTQVIVDIVTDRLVKYFDVDDVITNFLGGFIGLMIGLFCIKYYEEFIKDKIIKFRQKNKDNQMSNDI